MALDGIAISSIVKQLNETLINCRIDKIYQPEKDELIISIRGFKEKHKMLMTSNASSARVHLTKTVKENPIKAPLFSMVLRKHIGNGKILNITQPNFERIVIFEIEALNELGDISTKKLIIEIMGKHSNIILLDSNDIILDSIKRITFETSSVRQILPGKEYCYPPSQNKVNPLTLNYDIFKEKLISYSDLDIKTMIYMSYNGISPTASHNICLYSKVATDIKCINLTELNKTDIFNTLSLLVKQIKEHKYTPYIIFDTEKLPKDISFVDILTPKNELKESFTNTSEMLEFFYKEKDLANRVRQKSQDISRLVLTNIDRCSKKDILYEKTLLKTQNKQQFKVKGELVTANIHNLSKGMSSFTTQNFYDPNLLDITIKLDANLTPAENAQKYFKKYNKDKRTEIAIKEQICQNNIEKAYLDTILSSISNSLDERDIADIRNELSEAGFVKKRSYKKGEKPKPSKPLKFLSQNGFEIYVGKNNIQNDKLTLKFAENTDIWFHTKDIPGSHVILKTNGKQPEDADLLDAINLAAFFSKGKNSSKVTVDYALKKFVKKPSGAKPGMVIYTNNKTAYVTPDINKIEKLS
jgi:predicted ribosome quality control (RQC) complex YloA/Tae2 family protein